VDLYADQRRMMNDVEHMSEIEELEQIAEQAACTIDIGQRVRRNGRSKVLNYSVSPGLLRAHVAREKPAKETKPPAPIVREEPPVISASADGDAGTAGPLASIGDYDDLHKALRLRAEEMGFARRTIDELAGLTGGLTEKILGPRQRRKLGMKSLGGLLKVLRVKLLMVEDLEAFGDTEQEVPAKRCEYQVRHREVSHGG
jgi:hypothetical protein